jgi:hypothetical protein
MERDYVHNETNTGRKIQTGEQVENSQSVCAPFMQSYGVISTCSGRCIGSSPSPRLIPVDREGLGASGNTSCETYHVAVECHLVDNSK